MAKTNKARESKPDIFTREELVDIKNRAQRMSTCRELSPHWRRAYEALALAADHMDAMEARCTISR